MTEEVCAKCGSDLADFTEDPCIECAYQHDPHEPNYNEELDFSDEVASDARYIDEVYVLEEFGDVYDTVHRDYDREDNK